MPGIDSFYFSSEKKYGKNIDKFPIVAKIAEGSTGTSVFKFNNSAEIAEFIDKRNIDGNFFIFQKNFKYLNSS